jgi:hypothetical protein
MVPIDSQTAVGATLVVASIVGVVIMGLSMKAYIRKWAEYGA